MNILCSLQRAAPKSCSFSRWACLSSVFHQVAQYIKFEMPVLQSFITKLKEEEDREVQKLQRKYDNTLASVPWWNNKNTSPPLLVPAGILIWGVWLKNSSVVFQKAQRVGDLLFTSTRKNNEENSSGPPVPHIFQSVSIHLELARCKFVHVWCVFYCPESDCYLCFSLLHHAQQRGEKSLSDSSPLEQNGPKRILFCFLVLSKLMAKINLKHKTYRPSKVPVERLKGPSTNTSEVLTIAGKCVDDVTLIRISGLLYLWNSLFIQRLSVNGPPWQTPFRWMFTVLL